MVLGTPRCYLNGCSLYLHIQIHKAKAEKARERILKEERQAKRDKTKAARDRKLERVKEKRNAALAGSDDEEKTEKK